MPNNPGNSSNPNDPKKKPINPAALGNPQIKSAAVIQEVEPMDDLQDETLPDENLDSTTQAPHDPSSEPYGAQILRRIHDDHSRLLADYDSLLGPLEHPKVRKLMERKLQNIEKELCDFEALWGSDDIYKGLPPLEDAMDGDPDAMDGEPTEAIQEDEMDAVADEGYEDAPMEEGYPEEEFVEGDPYGGDDMDTMDDVAVPADSGAELEETPPEEAWEASQADPSDNPFDKAIKSWEQASSQLKKKDMTKKGSCLTCGKAKCICKSMKTKANYTMDEDEPLVDPDEQEWGREWDESDEYENLMDEKDIVRTSETTGGTPGHAAVLGESMLRRSKVPHPKAAARKVRMSSKPLTHEEAKVIRDKERRGNGVNPLAHQYTDKSLKGDLGAWDVNELHKVGEIQSFLNELGNPGSSFDDEARMKSYHFHKIMDEMVVSPVSTEEQAPDKTPNSPAHYVAPNNTPVQAVAPYIRQRNPVEPTTVHRRSEQNTMDQGGTRRGYDPHEFGSELYDYPDDVKEKKSGDDPSSSGDGDNRPSNPNSSVNTPGPADAGGLWEGVEVINWEDEKSIHPHRKMCKDASGFFKKLSQERAFGDPHRQEAQGFYTKLSELLGGDTKATTEEDDGTPEMPLMSRETDPYGNPESIRMNAEELRNNGQTYRGVYEQRRRLEGNKSFDVTLDNQELELNKLQKTLESLSSVIGKY